MQMLKVRHITRYRYARPVRLGEHRMMLRPREDPDQTLVFERLIITPEPRMLRIERDGLGNFVAIARFEGVAHELCFDNEIIVARHLEPPRSEVPLPGLRPFPRILAEDLGLEAWASRFVGRRAAAGLPAIAAMTAYVHRTFGYRRRLERGVQSAEQTLALRSGACRDFAVLICAAARALGLRARFVSGYVHCADSADAPASPVGGHTHAWAQVFTPEAGWVDFDATSGRVGSAGLIRVAVADDPADTAPIQGVYDGAADDFLHMEVAVMVEAAAPSVDSVPSPEPSPLWSVA